MATINSIINAIVRLFRWWVVVAPWERCVRVRFGKRVALLGPGIRLCFPFVDRAYVQSVRLRLSILPSQTISTADGKAVVLRGVVSFRIIDLLLLFQSVHDVEDIVTDMTSAALVRAVNKTPSGDLSLDEVCSRALNSIDYSRYGLEVEGITVAEFAIVPRVYRIITGDMRTWKFGEALDINKGAAD